MKLGIKVGPRKSSLNHLAATNPAMVEVWFDVNRAQEYTDLFDKLKKRGIDVGLHFWGSLPDNTLANISYEDKSLSDASISLIHKTVDIAAANKFSYVNIHPGGLAKVKIDLINQDYSEISNPVNLKLAEEIFLENIQILHKYALNHNIVLTVETVCRRVPKTAWYESTSRLKPLNIFELPTESIIFASQQGLFIANDFGHTGAIISDKEKTIWAYLKRTTEILAPQTKLIHLGFVVPPYNGTDFHDTLENPLLETDLAVPNRNQMIQLLKLFQRRDDVWILVEPKKDHVKNYFLAQKIVQDAGVI